MYRAEPIKDFVAGPHVGYMHSTRRGSPRRLPGLMARIRGLWAILSGVEDPRLREDLTLLATVLQVRFAERSVKEASVLEFMAFRFRWPATRTRRRLEGLVDLGVLRVSRDLTDRWAKVFEVVDRPHVPPAMAFQMGA